MNKILAILSALLIATSFAAPPSVNDVKVSQAVKVSPPTWNDQFITPTAFGVIGFDANLKPTVRGEQVFDVKADYGAYGDLIHDDTAAVQAAAAAAAAYVTLSANNAAVIHFPAGSFLINSGITITKNRISIKGDGRGSTFIYYGGTTGDVIRYYNAASPVLHFEISDLGIYCTGNVTAGTLLHLMNCGNVTGHDLELDGGFVGLQIESGADQHFTNLSIFSDNNWSGQVAGSSGIVIKRLGTTGGIPAEMFFSNINVRGQTGNNYVTNSLVINAADGLWFQNIHLGFCYGACVFIGPSNNNDQLTGIHMSNAWLDGGLRGIQFSDNGTVPTSVSGFHHFTNMTAVGGTGVDGASVDCGSTVQVYSTIFTNCLFGRNASGYPVRITAGAHFSFDSCDFIDWGLAATPGIAIIGPTTFVGLSNCNFYRTGGSFQIPPIGVSLSGASDYVRVINNTLAGAATPISNTSSGSHNLLTPNL